MKKTFNPRTKRLTPAKLRLSKADRAFFNDLAKVQIISFDQASTNHYSHLKTKGSRSLPRLVEAGLIQERVVYISGKKPVKTYAFANKAIAKAFGGRLDITSSTRSDKHELMTSQLYFDSNCPDDFRLSTRFSADDRQMIGDHLPDAMFTNVHGEPILVEADAGNYSKHQIAEKVNSWAARGLSQIWGQPAQPTYRLGSALGLEVKVIK